MNRVARRRLAKLGEEGLKALAEAVKRRPAWEKHRHQRKPREKAVIVECLK